MKKSLHRVSDHAVLRYLERCKGVDVENVRRELGRKVDDAVRRGASGLISDGFVFKLSPVGTVITVQEQNRPDLRTGRVRKGERET